MVSFCQVAWANLDNLLSALCAIVLQGGPLLETIQVQADNKTKQNSGRGAGLSRSGSIPICLCGFALLDA
jgi:hypothetical protein